MRQASISEQPFSKSDFCQIIYHGVGNRRDGFLCAVMPDTLE